ncbi:SAM-dependent methyltransferase [Streptomyces sp. NPDC051940]|uniref:SAM-dependent methyltransferase n=1 Tax=Streptomyces sp. NPDC051940 TaxID=3155675 RepID=UPI003448B135
MTDPQPERPVIDVTRPSIARVYDALLGGKDNYPVDREVAERIRTTMPAIRAQSNREFLGRVVRFLAADAGIRQFVDLGAGLPTMENTHQVAQRHQPGAGVVYVDNDPVVLAHGDALLVENDRTAVITADLRDPERVLNHPETRRLIDFDEPVAVLLVGILHHFADEENIKGVVDAYMAAVPSGSHLVISHFWDSGEEARTLEKTFLRFLGSGRFRTQEEIEAYFDGLELLEPGVVPLTRWRPEGPAVVPGGQPVTTRLMVAGVARKP